MDSFRKYRVILHLIKPFKGLVIIKIIKFNSTPAKTFARVNVFSLVYIRYMHYSRKNNCASNDIPECKYMYELICCFMLLQYCRYLLAGMPYDNPDKHIAL